MNNKEITVSVICLTYNHEKYIRQTLDGFLSQSADFNFEVIIHDDASTDGSPEIIKEYAAKYPDTVFPVFQTENQRTKRAPVHKLFTIPLVRGRYIALCDGDDYWSDPRKLQKQFDIMEANSDCSMCVHTVQVINEDGSLYDYKYPAMEINKERIYTQEFLDLMQNYPFQTSSYFLRAELWKSLYLNPPQFRRVVHVGDTPMMLYMLTFGPVYFIKDCMSVYRRLASGSWNSMMLNDVNKRARHLSEMYQMMQLYDEYTEHKYDCYLWQHRGRALVYSHKYREVLKKENRRYFRHLSFPRKVYVILCAVFPFFDRLLK